MQILHPFMPFITEELWQNLRERQAGEFLCTAQLFAPSDFDQLMLAEFELIKETTTAVRAFRTEKGISPKDPIELYLNSETPELFQRYQSIFAQLINVSALHEAEQKPDQTGSLRVGTHELYIPLTNVDLDAEREKIQKEIEYQEGFLVKVKKKLSNEKFVANAPEQVVALERKKQADAEAKLETLRKGLVELG
jgi:valyl-tRNA synthetase